MKQFVITPAAGKRLIGKAITKHPAVTEALKKGTVVIIAGTTNGYVAEEILSALGGERILTGNVFFVESPFHRTVLPNPGGFLTQVLSRVT